MEKIIDIYPDKEEIVYELSEGEPVRVAKQDVLNFIEAQDLNSYTGGPGLIGDPHAREETIYTDSEDYLDENWDEITKLYYNTELC